MKKSRLLGLILTLCMCFAIAMPAWAADDNEQMAVPTMAPRSQFEQITLPTESQQNELVYLLKFIGALRTPWFVDNTDYADITVGRGIPNYIYTEDGFEPFRTFFPVFSGDKLIAIAAENSGTGLFNLDTALAKQIEQYVDNTTEFALVFDQQFCYLFNGNEWIMLIEYPYFDPDDAVLNTNVRIDTSNITLNSFEERVELSIFSENEYNTLGLLSDINIEDFPRYQCTIDNPVRQTGDDTCWAASIATIINFRQGKFLTDVDVAKKYYGDNYDQGLSVSKGPTVLSMYGITNYNNDSNPNGVQLANNISLQYPVYANFKIVGTNYHACVANAIDFNFKYLNVWDPDLAEWLIADKQADGTYALDNTKHIYSLTRAAMPYWN